MASYDIGSLLKIGMRFFSKKYYQQHPKSVSYLLQGGMTMYLICLILVIIQFLIVCQISLRVNQILPIVFPMGQDLKCLPSGWPSEGTSVFWPFYFYPEIPSIQDAFEDNGKITIIINCEFVKTHEYYDSRLQLAFSHQWALFLHNDDFSSPINANDPIISEKLDGYFDLGKAFPLIFSLPKQYQNRFNYATIQLILNKTFTTYRAPNPNEVTYNPQYHRGETEYQGYQNYTRILFDPINHHNLMDYGLIYRYVPFCPILDKYSIYVNNGTRPKKSFMRICTQNLLFEDKKRNVDILRWALYHINQGFETPVIYYNKVVSKDNHQPKSEDEYEQIKQRTFELLQLAIDQKIIELVNFEFPYSFYFHDQLAQEMSCLRRNRDRTLWLGMNDVDEYFYSFLQDIPISESILRFTNKDFFSRYSGIVAANVFMKVQKDGTIQHDEKFSFEERTKCIIIPNNVNQYMIHHVLSGLEMYFLLDRSIINAHFKIMPPEEYEHFYDAPRMTAMYQQFENEAVNLLNSKGRN